MPVERAWAGQRTFSCLINGQYAIEERASDPRSCSCDIMYGAIIRASSAAVSASMWTVVPRSFDTSGYLLSAALNGLETVQERYPMNDLIRSLHPMQRAS